MAAAAVTVVGRNDAIKINDAEQKGMLYYITDIMFFAIVRNVMILLLSLLLHHRDRRNVRSSICVKLVNEPSIMHTRYENDYDNIIYLQRVS